MKNKMMPQTKKDDKIGLRLFAVFVRSEIWFSLSLMCYLSMSKINDDG